MGRNSLVRGGIVLVLLVSFAGGVYAAVCCKRQKTPYNCVVVTVPNGGTNSWFTQCLVGTGCSGFFYDPMKGPSANMDMMAMMMYPNFYGDACFPNFSPDDAVSGEK